MIECAVFDFDGTLVDSNEIKRQVFFDVLRNCDPCGAAVREVLDSNPSGDRHVVTLEIARTLAARGALPEPRHVEEWGRRWAREYTRRCERAVSRCPEIPGATEALRWLRDRGTALFLCSTTPEPALARVVGLRSLDGYFTGLYGAPRSKLENLRRIGERTGIGPEKMLVVGDGEDDRVAAAAFGCHFVGLVRPGADRFARTPRRRIPDLTRLRRVVEEIDGPREILAEGG